MPIHSKLSSPKQLPKADMHIDMLNSQSSITNSLISSCITNEKEPVFRSIDTRDSAVFRSSSDIIVQVVKSRLPVPILWPVSCPKCWTAASLLLLGAFWGPLQVVASRLNYFSVAWTEPPSSTPGSIITAGVSNHIPCSTISILLLKILYLHTTHKTMD